MKIYAGKDNYVPKATTKTLHSGSGKVRLILACLDVSGGATGDVFVYDNTAATGGIICRISLTQYTTPALLKYDELLPLKFETGLTITTSTHVTAHLITEA